MIGEASDGKGPVPRASKACWTHLALPGAVCAMVIGIYVWGAKPGRWELSGLNPSNLYYNLLVQGFDAGQMNLKKEVPPGLAQMADPYDPVANSSYRSLEGLHDLSFYRGKLYLYFGVTPVLVLFWPYHALTGQYLPHKDAVLIFCTAGFLAAAGLWWAVWRRYFAQVGLGVVVAGILALGLATGMPLLLARSSVCEVPISCGHALTMLALLLIWVALHDLRRRGWWLAGASLAYGLALGARPSLLFGAVILLVPVFQGRSQRSGVGSQGAWKLLLAATVPITVIGLGLLFYNFLRFDNPLEFGQRYQLSAFHQYAMQQFSPGYLWFNFRVGFLEPAHWGSHFPFLQDIAVPPLPPGYNEVDHPFGVLTNIPLVWLALAAPLAWRGRLAEERSSLRNLLATLALLFGACALVLVFHNSMCLRYEVEFTFPLVCLAVIGILGLERALAGRTGWQHATRWVWGLLLAYSMAFNLLMRFQIYSATCYELGCSALRKGQVAEALVHLEQAVAMQPANADARNNLGAAMFRGGRVPEAIGHYEAALRLKPDYSDAHYNLGLALAQTGRGSEAAQHYEQALRGMPDYADAHYQLGNALIQQGRLSEAIGPFEQALRVKPQHVEARHNLGIALVQLGRVPEAVGHLERVLQLRPGDAETAGNLGLALVQLGEGLAAQGKWNEAIAQYVRAVPLSSDNGPAYDGLGFALNRVGRQAEAVEHYRRALAIDPGLVAAQNHLAWVLATAADPAIRNVEEAVRYAERACELTTNAVASYLDTLGVAYSESGRFNDAVQAAGRGLECARAAGNKDLAALIESRLTHYRSGRPYHTISEGTGP